MADVTPSSKMKGSPTRRRAAAGRESASRAGPTAQAEEHAEGQAEEQAEEQAEDTISASDLATAATKKLTETVKTVLLSTHLEQPAIVYKPPLIGVVIWIDSLDPSLILENRPARAFFTIYNGTWDTQPIGFVGASIEPLHSINPVSGDTIFQIPKLQPLEMVSGVVSFTAPRSDLKNVLTLNYYQSGPIVAEFRSTILIASASQDFDIGARYVIKPNQIRISDTASPDDDTLYMGFSGRCGEVTDDEYKYLGDHSEGVSLSFNGLGPIDSIPGISPTAVISYIVINNGHGDTPAKITKLLNDISHASALIVTYVATVLYGPLIGAGAGAASAAIDALMHLFHDNVWQDCDCQLISDTHTISSQQLYDSTFDAADRITSSQVWDQQDGPSPCYGNVWRYRLAWEIIRQRSPQEIATVTPRYSSIPLAQELSLVGADAIAGPLGRTGWEWDVVAGSGKVDENGRFKAPSVSDPLSNYAVVRARHVLNGEQKSVGYSIVQFD